MLSVDNITTFYDRSQVLFGMSLAVGGGEVVTLMGRNGMGKTTTVRSIMGFSRISEGQIVFEGTRLDTMPAYQVARAGIGLVPEGRQVFPNLTVYENLFATSANRRNVASPWTTRRIFDLFPHLAERAGHMGNSISGGEQQMVAIGRALATNPRLLILDEATEGLAPLIQEEIWRVLRELKDEGLSILIIDKDIDALLTLADRHYFVLNGQAQWSGTSDELRSNPGIIETYLGV